MPTASLRSFHAKLVILRKRSSSTVASTVGPINDLAVLKARENRNWPTSNTRRSMIAGDKKVYALQWDGRLRLQVPQIRRVPSSIVLTRVVGGRPDETRRNEAAAERWKEEVFWLASFCYSCYVYQVWRSCIPQPYPKPSFLHSTAAGSRTTFVCFPFLFLLGDAVSRCHRVAVMVAKKVAERTKTKKQRRICSYTRRRRKETRALNGSKNDWLPCLPSMP